MKKKKLKLKDDVIIYSCLLAALICLILGGKDYFESLKEKSNIKDEITGAIHELQGKEIEENIVYEEPQELQKIDKKEIIIKYLDSIIDQIKTDDLLNYDMLKTWGDYEVLNVIYEREITDNYYSYQVDIKVSNREAQLPTIKNKKLSKDNYIVVTINANISNSIENNSYEVKCLSIPREN